MLQQELESLCHLGSTQALKKLGFTSEQVKNICIACFGHTNNDETKKRSNKK